MKHKSKDLAPARDTVSSPSWRKTLLAMRNHWQLYAMLLLPVASLILFNYVPMYGLKIAFQNYVGGKGLDQSEWVGLANFKRFFNSYDCWRILRNTVTITFYFLLVMKPLSVSFALMINAIPNLRFKKWTQTLTCMPHFISVVVVVGMMFQIFNPVIGLYGMAHRLLGHRGYPPDIIGRSGNFFHFYVWSSVWQELGWSTIIYLSVLTAVDPNLHEAAQIDGASRLRRMFHIDWPAIIPTFSILFIMSCGNLLSVGFEKVFLMQRDSNRAVSEVLSTYVYNVGIGSGGGEFSYAAAIGMLTNIVNALILVIVNFIAGKTKQSTLF